MQIRYSARMHRRDIIAVVFLQLILCLCSNRQIYIPAKFSGSTVLHYKCSCYRIVGNFCGVLIFVTNLTVTKFCTHKTLRQWVKVVRRKVAASVHTIVIERMALYLASLCPVECLRLSNTVLNWKSLCFCHFGDGHC